MRASIDHIVTPPSGCSTVFAPFQLLENHTAPAPSRIVFAIVSPLPGSPLFVSDTSYVALPSTSIDPLVMS
jgi:hypothetical protein